MTGRKVNRVKKRILYIPEPILQHKLFTGSLPSKVMRDKLAFIVGEILRAQYQYDLNNEDELHDKYVQICTSHLKSIMANYKPNLDYLIESRFIESDDHYVVNEKCKCYRLCHMMNGVVEPYDLTHRPMLIKMNQKDNMRGKGLEKYRHLTKCFNSKLSIDFQEAMAYSERAYEIELQKYGADYALPRHNCRRLSIHKVHSGEFHLSSKGKDKRLHSVLTNMPKDIRCYLQYDGQHLKDWDIRNSQPLFSTLLFDRNFYCERSPLNLYSFLKENSSIHLPPSIYTTMISFFQEGIDHEDVKRYSDVCKNGTLYDEMVKTYADNGDFLEKEDVKLLILKMLYSNPKDPTKKKDRDLFASQFPNVLRVFDWYKELNHSSLAILLQNIEAHVVLDKLARDVQGSWPDCPLFSIHDSLLFPEGYHGLIEPFLKERLLEVLELSIPD